jgi:hypothetical protein
MEGEEEDREETAAKCRNIEDICELQGRHFLSIDHWIEAN